MTQSNLRYLAPVDRKIFNGLGQIERKTKHGDFLGTMRDDLNIALLTGVAGYARLPMSVQPTHEDIVTVGRNTYQFLDDGTSTVVTNDAYIAVDLGADAAAARANLIAAINGTADAKSGTYTLADEETAADGIGYEKVYAAETGTFVRVRPAVKQGGSIDYRAAADITLSATLTTSAAWNVTSLDKAGLDQFTSRLQCLKLAITTAMLATGYVEFGVEFDVRGVLVQALTSGGKVKKTLDDAVTFSGKTITVALPGTTAATKTTTRSVPLAATADVTRNGQDFIGAAAVVTAVKVVIPEDDSGGALTVTVNKVSAAGSRTALASGVDITGASPRVPFAITGLTVPFALAADESLEFLVIGGSGLSAPTGVTFQWTYYETGYNLVNGDVLSLAIFG